MRVFGLGFRVEGLRLPRDTDRGMLPSVLFVGFWPVACRLVLQHFASGLGCRGLALDLGCASSSYALDMR